MEFVNGIGIGLYIFLGALLVFVIVLVAGPFLSEKRAIQSMIFGGVISMLMVVASGVIFVNDVGTAKGVIRDRIVDTYGIELSSSGFGSLGYPMHKPDEGRIVQYGTISSNSELAGGSVGETGATLVWTANEFKLLEVTTDGTLGNELPRVNEAKE